MSTTTAAAVHVETRQDVSRIPSAVAYAASVAVGVAAVGSGVFMRAWYLFHRPVSSDEAIAGLMARQILHGHFFAFYWGQVYGGAEPYVTALGFRIFGTSTWVLRAVPLALSLAAALLTWRIVKRLVGDPVIAVLAGAAVWAAPDAAVSNSFIEWGFRGVTLVCGLAVLLLVLRILDGDGSWWVYAALGLAAGIGWWSSPEIAYFLVPGGLLLLGLLWSRRADLVSLLPRLGVLIAGLVIGAFPWLWANVKSGFDSLKPSAFGTPPHPVSYSGRLHLFFHYSLGMLFSLRDIFDGHWLGGKRVGVALLALTLVLLGIALLLGVIRGGRAIAIAVGTVVFPFLLAISPGTWFWQTGRYIGYVVPLYVMALAVGAFVVGRLVSGGRPSGPAAALRSGAVARLTFSVVAGFLVATALISFVDDPTPGISLSARWSDPNGASAKAVRVLESAGVSYGYADYWVAYRLDYLSNEHLKLTVGKGELDRWPALARTVSSHGRAAWIFVKPTPLAASQFVDVSGGPGGLAESTFVDQLKLNSIGYRVVDAGVVDAVILNTPVPAADFWPAQ